MAFFIASTEVIRAACSLSKPQRSLRSVRSRGLGGRSRDMTVWQAKQTMDKTTRKPLWHDIQVKEGEEQPTGPFLCAPTLVTATQKWVQGFVPFPDKAHREWEDVGMKSRAKGTISQSGLSVSADRRASQPACSRW